MYATKVICMLQKSYAQFFKTAILKKAQLIKPDNLTLRKTLRSCTNFVPFNDTADIFILGKNYLVVISHKNIPMISLTFNLNAAEDSIKFGFHHSHGFSLGLQNCQRSFCF